MVKNKDFSTKLTFLAAILISLSGCFSHWQGDTAKLFISFSGADRTAYKANDTATHQKLEHKIVLTSETETLTFNFKGGTSFEADLAPGNWNVKVDSYEGTEIYAIGSKDVVLKLGQNNETIEMYQAFLVTFSANGGSGTVKPLIVKAGEKATLPSGSGFSKTGYSFDSWNTNANGTGTKYFAGSEYTTNKTSKGITLYAFWKISEPVGNTLAEKLNWISTYAVNDGNYIITVNTNENLAPQNLSYSGKKLSITLKGDTQARTVNLSGNGSLFTVGSNVTLILDNNITLIGRASNTAQLIYISSGGTLEMNAGSKITGNTNTTNNNCGGGVYVLNGGTFNMNGGDIFKNKVNYAGGGVYVHGTFTMNGGDIHDNEVIENGGGGVEVNGTGIFTMTKGNIYKNTASSGGGIYVSNGTFTMNGGDIYENTPINGGGGVEVGFSNGKFTMNGGNIHHNTTNGGGGVSVFNGGTFTMNSGSIYTNTVMNDGGGVTVGDRGKFIMEGGKIYNNTTFENGGGGVKTRENGTFTMNGGEIYSNTAPYGGGVEVWNGIFNKVKKDTGGGTINGNIASSEVYAERTDYTTKVRTTSISSNEELYYDGTTDPPTFRGAWDN